MCVSSHFPKKKLHTAQCIFRVEIQQSAGFWPASPPVSPPPRGSLASGTHTLTHTRPRTHKSFLVSGRNEYPTAHSNGTTRWSPIGLDHGTSLRDGCELFVVCLSGGSYWDSFLSFSLVRGKRLVLVTWNLQEIKELEAIFFSAFYWSLLSYQYVTLLTHSTRRFSKYVYVYNVWIWKVSSPSLQEIFLAPVTMQKI